MRILKRSLLPLSLALVCSLSAWARNGQNNETFSAGAGGSYDPSVCNDPRIAISAAELKSTAYHDPTPAGNGVLSPLRAALNVLAQKTGNPQVNNASVCTGAPGVLYFVPTNLVGQVTQLVEQEEAAQQAGDSYSASGNTTSSGQPGGTNGTNGTGGTGGPGGQGTSDTPRMPGPAGGIGFVPGPNPCIAGGGYNYCNNGPGARLPAGCSCTVTKVVTPPAKTTTPPPPGEKGLNVTPIPPDTIVTRTDPSALDAAMNACLKRVVPYWTDATPDATTRKLALSKYAASNVKTPYAPVFEEEIGMADSALLEHDSQYTLTRAWVLEPYPTSSVDYMVGWLYRCLQDSKLVPATSNFSDTNPLTLYPMFLGVNQDNQRMKDFNSGFDWETIYPPAPMLPPGQRYFNP